MSTKRKLRWEMVFVLPSFVALAAALGAIRAGFSPDRLWPVADFLMVWAGSASYVSLASKATRRRAFRLWRTPVPRGVRLRKPIWIALDTFFMLVGLSAALGTVTAAVGFPGVGVGMALALGGILTFPAVSGFGATALTFEDTGLRVHIGSTQCLVPWTSISDTEAIGPDGFQLIYLSITDPDRIVASVVPDTPRNRKRVQRLFGQAGALQGSLMLDHWAAGLDGRSLLRAIREGMNGSPDQAN